MDKNLQLSILLPLQNQRSLVEQILEPLFELSSINFELFIIDDASTDGTGQAIYSLLDYYEHENTFFFEHTKPAGRGNCLSQLLNEVNTDIVWAIDTLESINESVLKNAIKQLRSSSYACLAQQFTFPTHEQEQLKFVREEEYPADSQFLWNLNNIVSTEHFFNPYLKRFHCLEWLLRVDKENFKAEKNFYTPASNTEKKKTAPFERREMATCFLRRHNVSKQFYPQVIDFLQQLPSTSPQKTDAEAEHELLDKAIQQKKEGQLSLALENVEKLLDNEPGNGAAKRLKVEILERKRRYVEASELKHELNIEKNVEQEHNSLSSSQIKTSIIIPTALYGKGALENCLLSITEYCNSTTTELIIIDNASLDDTFDYLEELEQKNFFNCKIITNRRNNGFAASVNQGFKAASGRYYGVLHNDIELKNSAIAHLEVLMDENTDFGMMGPLTDSTLNPEQLISNKTENSATIEETDYIDSFLMMIRADIDFKMDEDYTLAFFEDIDFSFQLREAGYKVGIATEVSVTHHYGNTTFALDLDTESRQYWKNISIFNKKWEVGPFSEEQLQGKDDFEQLLLLDEWANPLYPEEAIQEKFKQLFTSEMKNQIMKSDYDSNTLQRLTHLFMVMDERETMRRLEDRLTKPNLSVPFIYELIRYYFQKNIYSRCRHYLDRLTMQQQSVQSELYKLAILIDEKKVEQAIPKLASLLEEAPSNPLLYKLAGDIYMFKNDQEEAESFYRLAEQINPFEYSREKEKQG